MIRNLKTLMIAAMAVMVFGVVAASSAHAAEEKYHCSVAPCIVTTRPDGTGTTAHHVFIIKNSLGESASFTCKVLDAEGTSATVTFTELTLKNIIWTECNGNGQPVVVRTNGCHLKLTSTGAASPFGGIAHLECSSPKHIEIEVTGLGCRFEVTPQTVAGFNYTNINSKSETTVTAKIPGVVVEGPFPAGACLIKNSPPFTSEYTTGNTVVTGEVDPGETMVRAWFE